jgi:hypothetical protein
MIRRAVVVAAAVAALGLAASASALAYWSASGRGHGLGATASIGQVTGVVVTQASSVEVSWAPVAVSGGIVPTYSVARLSTPEQIVCTTTATTCSFATPTGQAKYSVAAHVGTWSGPESAQVKAS